MDVHDRVFAVLEVLRQYYSTRFITSITLNCEFSRKVFLLLGAPLPRLNLLDQLQKLQLTINCASRIFVNTISNNFLCSSMVSVAIIISSKYQNT